MCLSSERICDGVPNCPLHDDEIPCSKDKGNIRSLSVSNPSEFLEASEYHLLSHLNISGINFTISVNSFIGLFNLLVLDISDNDIKVLEPLVFKDLIRLEEIYLHGNNRLEEIDPDTLKGLKSLKSFTLTKTRISKIYPKTFVDMESLVLLNLSMNTISQLMEDAFYGLRSLRILDLRGNPIRLFAENIFTDLVSLYNLYSDIYLLCCLKPDSVSESRCFPQGDEFSSCDDLMRNEVLRIFLWVIGFTALLGNAFALTYRIALERRSFSTGNGVLLTNLCFSDFLMGLYLIIIAAADLSFRGSYVWNDMSWRESGLCKFAGISNY